MSPRLSQELIDKIRESNDIVELISEYIPLKRKGKNWFGLCPFHTEKSPSFSVNQEKQIYHCFGCGAGGNIFTFLMEHEKMGFGEALRFLARRANIQIPQYGVPRQENDLLFKANQFALSFYQSKLTSSSKAKDYLRERGYGEELWGEFKLGYAPAGWDNLLEEAKRRSLPPDLLSKVGLAVKSQKGSGYYDRFRDRLIFPIFNLSGGVVAFGGRTFPGAEEPKYLNTNETPIYHKGSLLYAIFNTKEHIRKKGWALVVEGYTDLLTLYQAGFRNVVASLGTSLTSGQAKLLSRYASKAVISYDADSAGEEASQRGMELLLEAGLEVELITLPPGEDPDGLVRKGKDRFAKCIEEAENFLDSRLRRLKAKHDTTTVAGKMLTIREIGSTLAHIKDPLRRRLWVRRAAQNLHIEEDLISSSLQQKGGENTSLPLRGAERAEIAVLGYLLSHPQRAGWVKERLEIDELRSSQVAQLLSSIYQATQRGEEFSPASLIDEHSELSGLITQASFGGEEPEEALTDYVRAIKGEALKRKMAQLKSQMEELEERGEEIKEEELMREYQRLSSQLKEKA